jgi:FKBP-type peptidyl-prolyl cis-trans isomerase
MRNQKTNMRSLAALALVFVTGLIACSKDQACKAVAPSTEAAQIEAYNATKGIAATKHYTGLYYQILDTGALGRPVRTSTVYVKYTGKLFNDTIFDSQLNPGATGFNLAGLIEGWKVALPFIGKGGHIRLTVPSSLAYGCLGSANTYDSTKSIPPNTPLFFDIELVDFF